MKDVTEMCRRKPSQDLLEYCRKNHFEGMPQTNEMMLKYAEAACMSPTKNVWQFTNTPEEHSRSNNREHTFNCETISTNLSHEMNSSLRFQSFQTVKHLLIVPLSEFKMSVRQ
jgi:hypothetical protein